MPDFLRKTASSVLWSLCRLLPVRKNKVVFCSLGGRGFGENPKAIALALLEKNRDLDLVWLTRHTDIPLPEGIRPCRYGSPRAVMELSTAAVWVGDSRGGAKYKKKSQRYLQTWHGFALKHIERSAKNLPAHYIAQCKRDSAQIDLLLSGSRFMTRVCREDFWYDGEIAEFGSPRNDVFFRQTDAGERVRAFYGLPADRQLLLYAPTFRDNGSTDCYNMDPEAVLRACEGRFGGRWTALLRLHPNAAKLSAGLFPYNGDTIVDATSYPDMQELLQAADLLITDYSSSMFDYALSGRPVLRFAADIREYQAERGFYFPLESLPFPLAESSDSLCRLVERFDADAQQQAWDAFREENGFCEDGKASQRCADWILRQLKG